jgi:undecaprenyl-diphosphatase
MSGMILLDSFLRPFWEWLNQWDTYLFLKINNDWTLPVLDNIYPWFREANAWVPLYLFLILFMVLNFKKQALNFILFVVLTLVLTDQISSNLIKNMVGRLRPCSDPDLAGHVRLLLDNCSGGYSFTSSHATNHFGFAMFVFILFKPLIKKWGRWLFVWAAAISYGQVYVGVHYPLDVLSGALLGCLIGFLTSRLYLQRFGPLTFESNQSSEA